MGYPDVADMSAGAGSSDSLHHRFLGAYGFDGRVGAVAAGEFLDLRDARVAPLFDDVGGAELCGECLPVGVT